MSKDSTASLRGWSRLSVAAKCPPVDAYRDVGAGEGCVEPRFVSDREISEARRYYGTACFYGYQTAMAWGNKVAALEEQQLEWFAQRTQQPSGANVAISCEGGHTQQK